MNKIVISLVIIIILIFSGFIIGKFFDVGLAYYIPFLLWFVALCIFNMFLDEGHVNIYLKPTNKT